MCITDVSLPVTYWCFSKSHLVRAAVGGRKVHPGSTLQRGIHPGERCETPLKSEEEALAVGSSSLAGVQEQWRAWPPPVVLSRMAISLKIYTLTLISSADCNLIIHLNQQIECGVAASSRTDTRGRDAGECSFWPCTRQLL